MPCTPDPVIITDLLEIADALVARPDTPIRGPAIVALRQLFRHALVWRRHVDEHANAGGYLPTEHRVPGLPINKVDAEALLMRVTKAIRAVIYRRMAQRKLERDAGGAIITGADLASYVLLQRMTREGYYDRPSDAPLLPADVGVTSSRPSDAPLQPAAPASTQPARRIRRLKQTGRILAG